MYMCNNGSVCIVTGPLELVAIGAMLLPLSRLKRECSLEL